MHRHWHMTNWLKNQRDWFPHNQKYCYLQWVRRMLSSPPVPYLSMCHDSHCLINPATLFLFDDQTDSMPEDHFHSLSIFDTYFVESQHWIMHDSIFAIHQLDLCIPWMQHYRIYRYTNILKRWVVIHKNHLI